MLSKQISIEYKKHDINFIMHHINNWGSSTSLRYKDINLYDHTAVCDIYENIVYVNKNISSVPVTVIHITNFFDPVSGFFMLLSCS